MGQNKYRRFESRSIRKWFTFFVFVALTIERQYWYSVLMTTVELTLQLPDRLARRAKDAGLLTAERIVELIEREIERQLNIDRLFMAMDSLANVPIPPLDEESLAEEIQAVRHARRS